jgi:hypothetical protein
MQVTTKRFFSKVAGAKYIFADGHEIQFRHGHYDFDPEQHVGTVNIPAMNGQLHQAHGRPKAEVYFEELQYLVTSGNPLIFDQDHLGGVSAPLPAEIDPSKNAHSEASIARVDAALANVKGRVTGEANAAGNGAPTDVNQSTIDPALQRAVFKPVGPGASAAVAAAKARSAQQAATLAANAANGVAQ